jgi:hypothetical protein
MARLGFPPDAIEKRRQEFGNAVSPLTPSEWLDSPASQATGHLWLGQ